MQKARNKSTLPLVAALLLSTSLVHAQTPIPAPPTAPLPSLLTTATKLFLGNAGDQENADCLRAYNDMTQGLTSLGRYQLVLDPNSADMILELHYEINLGQAVGGHDNNHSVRQFRLVLLDPRSHTVLWSLTEATNYANFQSNRNKNLDETVSKLVSDFDSLASAQPPNNKSKVKHPSFP